MNRKPMRSVPYWSEFTSHPPWSEQPAYREAFVAYLRQAGVSLVCPACQSDNWVLLNDDFGGHLAIDEADTPTVWNISVQRLCRACGRSERFIVRHRRAAQDAPPEFYPPIVPDRIPGKS